MPDLNQLFQNVHVAHLRALHAPTCAERGEQQAMAHYHQERLQVYAYPQPGSFAFG